MLTAAEIAVALGGATRNGCGRLARCCCHEDKQPSLSLKDGDDGKLLVKCFAGCDARDILAEFRRRGWFEDRGCGHRPAKAARAIRKRDPGKTGHSAFAAAIWRESVDPHGTLAEQYPCGRGLKLDDDLCGQVLRFHPRCPFGRDEAGKTIYVPALVVAFRPIRNDDETRLPQAIHRIGLNPDGSKLGKMMLGPVGGCAVKLDPDEDVEEGLGICEGIETGIAIRMAGWRPVWCLGSAGAIRTFGPIPGIECLTIFADHDQNGVGVSAARQCAQAWQAAGCEVFIRIPHGAGADWLDVQP
jgi:putative DNA primase/helicase